MITVVLGGLGGGKTLFAVEQAVHFSAAGVKVASNIKMAIPVEPIDPVVRVDGKGHVIGGFWEDESRWWGKAIILDEADYYFDAMDWAKFGPSFQRWLKSVRKARQEVILITQSFENLHVRIRRLAQRFVVCVNTARENPLIRDGWLPAWFGRYYRLEYSSPRLSESDLLAERYLTRREVVRYFGLYDTEQRVG